VSLSLVSLLPLSSLLVCGDAYIPLADFPSVVEVAVPIRTETLQIIDNL